ncbi:MAG: hypothetical protein AAB593_01980, partial [Patescibacteria group bacterium]
FDAVRYAAKTANATGKICAYCISQARDSARNGESAVDEIIPKTKKSINPMAIVNTIVLYRLYDDSFE